MAETEIGWAVLELMGHRRLGGYVSEQEVAGSAFVRIDVPSAHPDEWEATQYYSAAAVYCITPTTEAMARAAASDDWTAECAHMAAVQLVTGHASVAPEEVAQCATSS